MRGQQLVERQRVRGFLQLKQRHAPHGQLHHYPERAEAHARRLKPRAAVGCVRCREVKSCALGVEQSQACLDEWRDAGNDITGWYGATYGANASTMGSPYYPWCAYPCTADRPYSGDDISDSFTTGNYAKYW